MNDWIVTIALLVGALVMVLGSIGVVRMPDLFTRMQTATKPSMLGSSLIALAVSIHFGELFVTLRALLIAAFFFITAPVAAHAIARAAYFSGVELWSRSVTDELKGRYDSASGKLESSELPNEGRH
jgi:multicomponent Na+:H+ antiporter subunit G